VAIARALIVDPELVVLDEPTSSLDWQTQADLVERLALLQRDRGVGLIWISHNLELVRAVSHRVVVLRHGSIVESGLTEHVFGQPRHSYTQLLLDAAFPIERSLLSASTAPI
jgi:ABC-type microcin C transport system duplicated ATPase subunit YejF